MATIAILDPLFHKAHIFNIDGNSYRLKDFSDMIQDTQKEKTHEPIPRTKRVRKTMRPGFSIPACAKS